MEHDSEQADIPGALSVPVREARSENRRRSILRLGPSTAVALVVLVGIGFLAVNDVDTHHSLSSTRQSLVTNHASLSSEQDNLSSARRHLRELEAQVSAAQKRAATAMAAEAEQEAAFAATEQLYTAEDRYAQCLTSDHAAALDQTESASSPATSSPESESCPTTGLSAVEAQQIKKQVLPTS